MNKINNTFSYNIIYITHFINLFFLNIYISLFKIYETKIIYNQLN